jgi:hypothetical protein
MVRRSISPRSSCRRGAAVASLDDPAAAYAYSAGLLANAYSTLIDANGVPGCVTFGSGTEPYPLGNGVHDAACDFSTPAQATQTWTMTIIGFPN